MCAELDRASKLFQGCESAVRPTKMYIGNAQKTEVRLNSMPWFHGKIKREEAESLLTPREVGAGQFAKTENLICHLEAASH